MDALLERIHEAGAAPQSRPRRRGNPNRPADDFYPTPPHATAALLAAARFSGAILEPACGDGAIVRVLRRAGHRVLATDLNDHGCGTRGVDFLKPGPEGLAAIPRAPNIVTNPPYRQAAAFVRRALEATARSRQPGQVALLLRLAFLEGERREALFDTTPLARVLVFHKRLTMYPGGWTGRRGNSPTAHAWFIWAHGHAGPATIGWV